MTHTTAPASRLAEHILTYRTRRNAIDRAEGRMIRFCIHHVTSPSSHLADFVMRYMAYEKGISCSACFPLTSMNRQPQIRRFLDQISAHFPENMVNIAFFDCDGFFRIASGVLTDGVPDDRINAMLDEVSLYIESLLTAFGEELFAVIRGGDPDALADACIPKLPKWEGSFTPMYPAD